MNEWVRNAVVFVEEKTVLIGTSRSLRIKTFSLSPSQTWRYGLFIFILLYSFVILLKFPLHSADRISLEGFCRFLQHHICQQSTTKNEDFLLLLLCFLSTTASLQEMKLTSFLTCQTGLNNDYCSSWTLIFRTIESMNEKSSGAIRVVRYARESRNALDRTISLFGSWLTTIQSLTDEE